MSSFLVKVLPVLRGLLPMNKIAAWFLGVLTIVIAGVLGTQGDEIKEKYCANADLPKVEAPAVEVPAPLKEEK